MCMCCVCVCSNTYTLNVGYSDVSPLAGVEMRHLENNLMWEIPVWMVYLTRRPPREFNCLQGCIYLNICKV